jgi:gluconate 5-dehydrogenase
VRSEDIGVARLGDRLDALFGLSGRVALITGSARGLGLEIATQFAYCGATAVLTGRDQGRLSASVGALREAGLPAYPSVFDVADPAATTDALGKIVEAHGPIDILVSNVGERLRRPLHEVDRDAFAELLDINVTSSYFLARALAPSMAERGWGRLIFLSSTAAKVASANTVAYSASKAAVESMTRSFAVTYGRNGVTSNALAPGAFATETNQAMAASSGLATRVPAGRWGDPGEIAGAAVFLASPGASYVNGHVLTVDGGLTAAFG